MTERLSKILQEAEGAIKEANDKFEKGSCFSALFTGIKAVYCQNKAIIEMLKDYKK